MGGETEFGLTSAGLTQSAHTYLSAILVSAYADAEEERAAAEGRPGFLPSGGWDYSTERPLRDARGFTVPRRQAHPSQLTDAPAVVDALSVAAAGTPRSLRSQRALAARGRDELVTNTVLTNGARFYVDHAHPEYSSPEVMTPREAAVWDLAGDVVAMRAAAAAEAAGAPRIDLFKNNTDSKSSSYGTHENYLVDRAVPFESLAEGIMAFFVTRQVLCGAGRVGVGVPGGPVEARPGFQISQRADFMEELVGLETTLRRPIVNARDEPHSDESRFRRLHVIVGDANLLPSSITVRFAATSLVLRLIEDGICPDVRLEDPVDAIRSLSHDIPLEAPSTAAALAGAFRSPLRLDTGGTTTALAVQRTYLDAARRAYSGADAETDEALTLWGRLLDGLETDPLSLAADVDWIAKFRLVDGLRRRDGLAWDDVKLQAVDLQYALLDARRGLGQRLRAAGSAASLVSVTDEEVLEAVHRAPASTRAAARGHAVSSFADSLVSASWDTLTFSFASASAPTRIVLPDPSIGGAALAPALGAADAESFAESLARAVAAHTTALSADHHERSAP
ncbi:depupylase/deamidase Dop [Falsarthrobacter nasiphocae]